MSDLFFPALTSTIWEKEILPYLGALELCRMGLASRYFYDLCNGEQFWKILFQKMLSKDYSMSKRVTPCPNPDLCKFYCGENGSAKKHHRYYSEYLLCHCDTVDRNREGAYRKGYREGFQTAALKRRPDYNQYHFNFQFLHFIILLTFS
jgi:hypothetical protein